MLKLFLRLWVIAVFSSCISNRYALETRFGASPVPPVPDYSLQEAWAALPGMTDAADRIPGSGLSNGESNARADAFFVHPTIYTYKPSTPYQWNGNIQDAELNEKTDNSTMLYQASVFNGSCRVYAPRYRQAHISSFYSAQEEDGIRALEIAYCDVRAAFLYNLQHYNQGRPVIIASHSQGTYHARKLIQEFFSIDSLKDRLVVAYLVGLAIIPDSIPFIPPCTSADQTGCYCTWNTFANGYYPPFYGNALVHAVCTNPLSWSTDSTYAPAELNAGGVLKNFRKIHPEICDARVHQGLLWINKPAFPGSRFLNIKIYHVADYNLFYMNIRQNVQRRIDGYSR